MDLDPVPRSDEGALVSLSMLSDPYSGDSPASESSVTTRMINTLSCSSFSLEPPHQVNAPIYSHASDGLPSTVLHPPHRPTDNTISNHLQLLFSPREQQDIHKQTLGPDLHTGISSNKPAEDYNISDCPRSNVGSFINPSVCATTDDFDAVTRQPNCSLGNHHLIDVGVSSIDNESLIPSGFNVYSGLFTDDDLVAKTSSLEPDMPQSEAPDVRPGPVLSSPLGPLPVRWQPILIHAVDSDHFHEPSILLPEFLPPSKNTSDGCLQSTVTSHLPERQAALSLSLLLKSSHASFNAYNNNTTGSGSELATDELVTSHAEYLACSHENTPIDFAPEHSKIPFSQIDIDHAEKDSESHLSRVSSPDLETQDMDIQEIFASSPPLSPSTSSAYIMPSSSPIPSSSPVGPSFQTPPTSPPSSPVKDTQLEIWRSNNELLIPGAHGKYLSVPVGGSRTTIPSSGFADQDGQSMISPEVSTSPLQHQVPILSPSEHYVATSRVTAIAAENSSNSSATTALPDATIINIEEDEPSKETDVEQQRPNANVDAHRLKSVNKIPYPKRPTIATHRLQQKKLAQPFRSPVPPQASKVEPKPKPSATDFKADTVASHPPSKTSQDHLHSSSPTLDSKTKYRTTRAATQFKSPLSTPSGFDDSSLVRLTPTIQALERKLQILKRAVKVKEDVQEEVLEGLVKKWSDAGREVAWEVWNLVKDNVNSDGGYEGGRKRAFEGSWGWESSGDGKRQRDEEKERNWGWDIVPVSNPNEEEESKPSLGTMLMQLGVAPDTLGWNEEEGSFIQN